jgi:hypothetical protein
MTLRVGRFAPLAAALMITALAASIVSGCSETFGDKLREHRGCIGEAQIAPEKVDICMRNTNGRRQNVNVCLADQMVPDRKIRILNDCVNASEQQGSY